MYQGVGILGGGDRGRYNQRGRYLGSIRIPVGRFTYPPMVLTSNSGFQNAYG